MRDDQQRTMLLTAALFDAVAVIWLIGWSAGAQRTVVILLVAGVGVALAVLARSRPPLGTRLQRRSDDADG